MKELTRVFEGRNVRVFVDDAGEPWFIVKDVADVLGYTEHTDAIKILNTIEKGSHVVQGLYGGPQTMVTCSEPGLYRLIFSSRQERSEAFRRWVTSEVLPSIRKTGGYGIQSTTLALNLRDPKQLATFALQLCEIVAEKDKQLAEQAPKVESFDAFISATGTYSLQEAGKTLGVGANRFIWSLESSGYLYRNSKGYLLPKQQYVDQGLFVLRVGSHTHGGVAKTHHQTRVTPKGVDYFRAKSKPQLPLLLSSPSEDCQ